MPVRSYDELLLKSLQDPVTATAYLTACYEDSEPVFWQGLRMVVEAQGGIETLAQKTKIGHEQLFEILSATDNPPLSTLMIILDALGFSMSFSVIETRNVA